MRESKLPLFAGNVRIVGGGGMFLRLGVMGVAALAKTGVTAPRDKVTDFFSGDEA